MTFTFVQLRRAQVILKYAHHMEIDHINHLSANVNTNSQ